jgi:hypothetical protein
MTDYRLALAPMLPVWALIALGLVALAALLWSARTRPAAAALRALALGLVLFALVDPSLVREQRQGLDDVVAIVLDRSASQSFGARRAQTDAAAAELRKRLEALGKVDVRVIEAGARDADGTRLFDALQGGLADTPPERVGAVFMITDGVVHDIPADAAGFGYKAPLHALITGRPDEYDRRVALIEAQRFGLVGKPTTIRARVVEQGASSGAPVRLTVSRDGVRVAEIDAAPGRELSIPVTVDHAGPNVVELDADVGQGEVTALNNKAVVIVEGVRDRLKVLLVSGEPHQGERMWRNLLMADPNVELVHFTILRPPEKQDGTPISELSLIAFPTADLFGPKITEFDLIVFDRYANQTILPTIYFENIARYVREGGALFMAVGPEFAGAESLYQTPLGAVSPAAPSGGIVERGFRARVTETGQKHPVTRGLLGDDSEAPTVDGSKWGEWRRMIGGALRPGAMALLAGPSQAPLLALKREDKGRVGILLSDQIWLWARGHDGGGPYLDLLRRSAHWLMKEPELEEEALRATARGREIAIERQSLGTVAREAVVTAPDGVETRVALAPAEPGLSRGRLTVERYGLYRVKDGDKTALVNVGPDNPKEFQEVVSTTEHLTPIAAATGGTVRRLAGSDGAVTLPRLAAMRQAPLYGGSDYVAIRRTEASVTTGVASAPLGLGVWALLALLGAAVAAWLVEGRRRR